MDKSTLPQELMTGSLLHFQSGVPIDDLDITPPQRRRLARVQHVYWQWSRNPFLDVYALFRQLVKGSFADKSSETRAAQKDKMLFDFVICNVAPPSRAVATAKVRAVADRLMKNGMATDNGKDMAEGAKIAMKLDRLDQPESEQADMSKIMFLPPVVVTDVSKIDDTKENVNDEEMKRIMDKYGGYKDDKMKDVDDMVKVMEARSGVAEEAATDYTDDTD